jgi:hypothetical protein
MSIYGFLLQYSEFHQNRGQIYTRNKFKLKRILRWCRKYIYVFASSLYTSLFCIWILNQVPSECVVSIFEISHNSSLLDSCSIAHNWINHIYSIIDIPIFILLVEYWWSLIIVEVYFWGKHSFYALCVESFPFFLYCYYCKKYLFNNLKINEISVTRRFILNILKILKNIKIRILILFKIWIFLCKIYNWVLKQMI